MTFHRITTKALLRALPSTKMDTIVALLRSRPLVHQNELIDALWGDDEGGGPDDAAGALSRYIWCLRHWRGYSIIAHYARGYELRE